MMKSFFMFVVGSKEISSCVDGRIVGCDGVNQSIESSLNSIQLALDNGVHGNKDDENELGGTKSKLQIL